MLVFAVSPSSWRSPVRFRSSYYFITIWCGTGRHAMLRTSCPARRRRVDSPLRDFSHCRLVGTELTVISSDGQVRLLDPPFWNNCLTPTDLPSAIVRSIHSKRCHRSYDTSALPGSKIFSMIASSFPNQFEFLLWIILLLSRAIHSLVTDPPLLEKMFYFKEAFGSFERTTRFPFVVQAGVSK